MRSARTADEHQANGTPTSLGSSKALRSPDESPSDQLEAPSGFALAGAPVTSLSDKQLMPPPKGIPNKKYHAANVLGRDAVNKRFDHLEEAVPILFSRLDIIMDNFEANANQAEDFDALDRRVLKIEMLLMRTSLEEFRRIDEYILECLPKCASLQSSFDEQLEAERLLENLNTVTNPKVPLDLQDELSFMVLKGSLNCKSEMSKQLLSSGKNDDFWHDVIYSTIAEEITKAHQQPPTTLLDVEIEEKYPGMIQSELWSKVCNKYWKGTKDGTWPSDAFLEISYTAFKFYVSILNSIQWSATSCQDE